MNSEPRRPENAIQLTKSAALSRLHAAVVEAHNRTSIAELGFIRRALFNLRLDWDDKFAHGYTKAILETLRDTEQDNFRRRLWFNITNRAILVCNLATMDSTAMEHEIDEIIADLGRLN